MSKEKLASSDYGTLSKYIDDSRKLLMMHTTTESIEIFIAMMDSCFMNSPGDTFEDALTTSLLKMMKYNKSQSE